MFSLGSFVPVSTMPNETAQCFMRVFSKLPLNVIWKWETTFPGNVSSNVLMVDWIPQQDLLGISFCLINWIYGNIWNEGHPNAKLILTHGGLIGTQEAIYHGVPILGLPFGNDQRANIVKPKRQGHALQLDWDKLNDDVLLSAINHLVYNPKYRLTLSFLSSLDCWLSKGSRERRKSIQTNERRTDSRQRIGRLLDRVRFTAQRDEASATGSERHAILQAVPPRRHRFSHCDSFVLLVFTLLLGKFCTEKTHS